MVYASRHHSSRRRCRLDLFAVLFTAAVLAASCDPGKITGPHLPEAGAGGETPHPGGGGAGGTVAGASPDGSPAAGSAGADPPPSDDAARAPQPDGASPVDAAPASDASPIAGQAGTNPINASNWDETTLYPFAKRRMLVRDEGSPHLALVDLGAPSPVVWKTATDGGWARAAQLIGNNQVLGGRSDGYDVYDLSTGALVKKVTGFANTQSAYRVASGETMLTRNGAVLTFLDKNDKVAHEISYPGYGYVRVARPTRNGTYLVPADSQLFEGDATGKVLWKTTGSGWGHIWEALLMKSGDTLLCTAFGASCDVVDKTSHKVTFRYGTKSMPNAGMFNPSFFAGFEILPNGNIITSNWQGHGSGNGSKGIQVIEFNPAGEVVWFWKQDPAQFSSIQGVQVLDGKNPMYLHVQETSDDSTWQPVIPTP